jgi:hypothetical protein
MNISANQTRDFIVDAWQLPGTDYNICIEDWIFDLNEKPQNQSKSYALLSWYHYPGGRSLNYNIMEIGPQRSDWKQVQYDWYELFQDHNGTNRQNLVAHDARPILWHGKYYIEYASYPQKRQFHKLFYGQVYYSKQINALYILSPSIVLDPHKESLGIPVTGRHQKNWMPFVYQQQHHNSLNTHHRYLNPYHRSYYKDNTTLLYQVYSVDPHVIVSTQLENVVDNHTYIDDQDILTIPNITTKYPQKEFLKQSYKRLAVHRIASSQFVPGNSSHSSRTRFWDYGEARGGTPAKLIWTKPYGWRYLTFFHSQRHTGIYRVLSYYMGAYLFEPTPPFQITHMTPDPIICNPCYNESFGWAFRSIDYIIFPMSFLVYPSDDGKRKKYMVKDDLYKERILFLTFGRNDRSGWVMTLNLSGLIDYMIPIDTKINFVANNSY